MAESGDWVTLQINGIRYLEKPPLPYWIDAALYRVFGAEHVCHASAQLAGDAWLRVAWRGSGQTAPGDDAPVSMPRSASSPPSGRFCIHVSPFPKRCSAFFCCSRSTALLPGWSRSRPARFYVMWAALALATLTKGLIAPVFFAAAAIPLLLLSGQWRRWRKLKPFIGIAAVSCHRGAMAHSCRAGEPRPGPSRRQPSHPRQCARLLVFLLRQRALPALPGPALSA